VRISVDDFGTGYSSLAHLRRFPVDELKIDRSFVSAIGHGGDGAGVAFATLGLARSLRLEVVAEGIEEEEQLVQLRRAHCTSGQGYYLWRPMDAAAVESLLTELDAAGVPAVPAPRVLVVDDDPVCRATTARLLANAGLEVTEATNGLDCLEMAARLAPDAIVVDVRLPDLDGVEVCRSVKSAPGNSPAVICVSGAAIDVEERSYGLDSGADAYLVKPVAPIELVAVVRAGIRARDERVVVAGVA
jgi:CheY-like chemotaxis protein